MQYDISPRKVAGIMVEVNQVLKNKGFNQAEVVIGLQELVGRTIVDMCTTSVQGSGMVDYAKKHLDDTVRIGFAIKEQSPISRV